MTALALVLGLAMAQAPVPTPAETLIDFDVKQADVLDVLRLLAEVGGFNLVADPDVSCKLTLRLTAVAWPQVLEVVLKTCRLGQERLGQNLVRVARVDQLIAEQVAQRKYAEEKRLAGERRTSYRRLAYARARELAPLLKKFLSPRGEVTFDERTNTLIITDVVK